MRFGAASIAAAFDWIYSEKYQKALGHLIISLSIVGFLTHLSFTYLARNLSNPPSFIAVAGRNYLASIYTPFSFILFYEVLLLISAIPKSTTRSLATQYQMVSLIFIRGFFKDISTLDFEELKNPLDFIPSFIDIGAGLIMFLLVEIFHRIALRQPHDPPPPHLLPALDQFIQRKKLIAFALTVVFIFLGLSSLWQLEIRILHAAAGIGKSRAGLYTGVFTAMIFTDVLILLLSLLIFDRYESVFRNAAFVISAILIRFSLSSPHPYGALLGLSGMLFGIFTLLIYNFTSRPVK